MKNRNGKHSSSLHSSKSSRTNVYIFILGSRQVGKFSAPPVPTSPQKKHFFNFPRKVGNISHHTFPTIHSRQFIIHTFQDTLYHFVKKSKKSSQPSNLTKSHTNKHPQTSQNHTQQTPANHPQPANLTKSHTNKHQQTIRNPQTSQNHTQTNTRKPSANHTPHTNYTQTIRKPHTNHAQKNTPEDPYLPGHSVSFCGGKIPFCGKIKKSPPSPQSRQKKRPQKIRTFQGHSIPYNPVYSAEQPCIGSIQQYCLHIVN